MDEKSSEYLFDEIEIGFKKKFQVTIIEHMLNDFAKLSGDYNPLHVNEEYASSTSLYVAKRPPKLFAIALASS